MRKILNLCIALALGILVAGCSREYDDSAIKGRLDTLEKEVSDIKIQISDLNSLVAGLKETIDQWKKGGYIERVEEIEGGHTITFVGGKTVTLYNGKNGQDGKDGEKGNTGDSPNISVVAGEDGELYWAIDGTPILVDGTPVPVQALPVFSLNDEGHLLVTVNGKVTDLGEIKAKSSDSIIKGIEEKDGKVIITLADGSVIDIPLANSFKLVVKETSYPGITDGAVIKIKYDVVNANASTVVDAFAGNGYKVSVNACEKELTVTAPTPVEDGQVLLWAQNENGLFSMLKLTFNAGTPEAEEFVVMTEVDQIAPGKNETLEVQVVSNVDFEVKIPEEVKWLHYIQTKSQTYIVTFALDVNDTGSPRTADVSILRKRDGSLLQTITFVQLAVEPDEDARLMDFGAAGWQDGETVESFKDDKMEVLFSIGTSELAPLYEAATGTVILNEGNAFTVKASQVIEKIVFVFDGSGNDNALVPEHGTFESPVWERDESDPRAEVTFTVEAATEGEGIRKLSQILVTLGDPVTPVAGETKVEKLWELLSTDSEAWNAYFGGTAGSDRNVAIDGEYVYIAEFGGSKNIWAIDIDNPDNVVAVNNSAIKSEGYDGSIFLACPRVVKTDNGDPILLVSNLSTGSTGWLYAYEDGIDAEPKCIELNQYGAGRRLGDTFTTYGTYEHLMMIFGSFWGNGFVTFQLPPNASLVSGLWNRFAIDIKGAGAYYPFPEDLTRGIYSLRDEARVNFMSVEASEEDLWATSSTAFATNVTRLNYSDGMNGSAAGYNFVKFNGMRYVIYGRETMNTKVGELYIREGEIGEDWADILGLDGTDDHIRDNAFYIDSFEGGMAAGNSAVDVAVWETGNEIYIALDKQRAGLAVYRMYIE